MKKEVTLAILATILVLQMVGNFVGGAVKQIADGITSSLTSQIQVEKILSGEQEWK